MNRQYAGVAALSLAGIAVTVSIPAIHAAQVVPPPALGALCIGTLGLLAMWAGWIAAGEGEVRWTSPIAAGVCVIGASTLVSPLVLSLGILLFGPPAMKLELPLWTFALSAAFSGVLGSLLGWCGGRIRYHHRHLSRR